MKSYTLRPDTSTLKLNFNVHLSGTVFTNTASEAMVAISTVKADEPVYSPSNNDLWRERFGGSIGDTPSRGGHGAKGVSSTAPLGTSSLASLGTVGPPNLGKKREQRTENREQRTENREQRTVNREQRTENREQKREKIETHNCALWCVCCV
jgi:hypothetical protein